MEWESGSLFIDHLRINTDFVPEASMMSIIFSAQDKKLVKIKEVCVLLG